MSVEQEIRGYSEQIDQLCSKVGVKHLSAFVQKTLSGVYEPLFVVDFDMSRREGYSDRFFDIMFGLQQIFARPVEVLEQEIFEREAKRYSVAPVELEMFHATA